MSVNFRSKKQSKMSGVMEFIQELNCPALLILDFPAPRIFPRKLEGKILEDREYPCFSNAYYNAWSIAETQRVIRKNKSDFILDQFLLL